MKTLSISVAILTVILASAARPARADFIYESFAMTIDVISADGSIRSNSDIRFIDLNKFNGIFKFENDPDRILGSDLVVEANLALRSDGFLVNNWQFESAINFRPSQTDVHDAIGLTWLTQSELDNMAFTLPYVEFFAFPFIEHFDTVSLVGVTTPAPVPSTFVMSTILAGLFGVVWTVRRSRQQFDNSPAG